MSVVHLSYPSLLRWLGEGQRLDNDLASRDR